MNGIEARSNRLGDDAMVRASLHSTYSVIDARGIGMGVRQDLPSLTAAGVLRQVGTSGGHAASIAQHEALVRLHTCGIDLQLVITSSEHISSLLDRSRRATLPHPLSEALSLCEMPIHVPHPFNFGSAWVDRGWPAFVDVLGQDRWGLARVDGRLAGLNWG